MNRLPSEEVVPQAYPDPRDPSAINYLDLLWSLTPYNLRERMHLYKMADWFQACTMLRWAGQEAQVLDLIAQVESYGAGQPDAREVYLSTTVMLTPIPSNPWSSTILTGQLVCFVRAQSTDTDGALQLILCGDSDYLAAVGYLGAMIDGFAAAFPPVSFNWGGKPLFLRC
jgi:hypothetical protein